MAAIVQEYITGVGMSAVKDLHGSGQLDSELEDAKESSLNPTRRRAGDGEGDEEKPATPASSTRDAQSTLTSPYPFFLVIQSPSHVYLNSEREGEG